MSETLKDLIITVIQVLIIPTLPILTAYITAFLKKKISELDNKIAQNDLSRYSTFAENAVITAVTAVNQTYVDHIKKNNESLSSYEKKVAFEMARERALKLIGERGTEVLKKEFKNFDAWMENQIEYYVNQSKNNPDNVRKAPLL